MRKKIVGLPILFLMIFGLVGIAYGGWGTSTISSCTLDGASASSTTVSDSTVSVGCTFGNATGINLYWKDTTAKVLSASAATSGPDWACNAVTGLAASNETAVTTACTLNGVGDDNSNFYFDTTNGSQTTTGTTYAIQQEAGYSTAQKSSNTQTQTSASGGNNNTWMYGVAALAVIILLIAAFQKKK